MSSKIFYNVNAPCLVVYQASQEVRIPPYFQQVIIPGSPTYPKVYGNANHFPRQLNNPSEEAQLPGDWQFLIELQKTLGYPPVPPVSLNPTGATVPTVGGSFTFAVTATGSGVSGTWVVTTDPVRWLTIKSPKKPQAFDGTVTYIVDKAPAARTANIYVNGQTFTVTQTYPV